MDVKVSVGAAGVIAIVQLYQARVRVVLIELHMSSSFEDLAQVVAPQRHLLATRAREGATKAHASSLTSPDSVGA
ncbi:MAG TPA: hypothetical protein VE258_06685, partial [Ktedonobacterales bacterium]|nr:hypothetical protein [Ktedonobacterales bacterium]